MDFRCAFAPLRLCGRNLLYIHSTLTFEAKPWEIEISEGFRSYQNYFVLIVSKTISGGTPKRTGRMLVPMPVVTKRWWLFSKTWPIDVAIAVVRGFDDTSNQWKSYLAAVSVAREEEGHALWEIRKYVGVVCQRDHRLSFRNHRNCVRNRLPSCPEICKSDEPELCSTHVEMYDFVFQYLNSVLAPNHDAPAPAVPPVVIAQHRIDAERRSQVFQDRTKMLGLDSASYTSVARHVITEDDNQFRLQLIRALDDRAQLLVVDEPVVDVDISKNGDSQAVELRRPVVDPDRLLANNQPAWFYEKSPESHAARNNTIAANRIRSLLAHREGRPQFIGPGERRFRGKERAASPSEEIAIGNDECVRPCW